MATNKVETKARAAARAGEVRQKTMLEHETEVEGTETTKGGGAGTRTEGYAPRLDLDHEGGSSSSTSS